MKFPAKLSVYLCVLPALSLSAIATAESEYEQWLKKTRGDFQTYLDENDKAFIQFLQQKWQPVDVKPAEQRDPKPKPVDLPEIPASAKPDAKPAVDDTPKVVLPKLPPVAEVPAPKPPAPELIKPPLAKPPLTKPPVDDKPGAEKPTLDKPVAEKPAKKPPVSGPVARFGFYGNAIEIPYNAKFKRNFSGKINNEKIASYWQQLASAEHKPTVQALQAEAQRLGLNDWGSAQLFDQFARALHKDSTSRKLTSWFLLVKAGYDARVAYNDKVHLLLTSEQEMFGVTFFRLGNKKYYAINLNEKALKPGKVFTYEGQHDEGSRALDFSQPNRFAIGGSEEQRQLKFKYRDQSYSIKVAYPQRFVSYFSSYPQLSLPNYFKAGLPAVTSESLLNQLRPVVAGKSEQEAVNHLLRFVQTAFAYQTDDEQFHEENYLFPLETLHYPYSDCEDRAALFAWLTESLLGLDVVILDFPGHVATAVAFNGGVQGDNWSWQGKRYTIADPTYVNADAGMTMPQFAGVKPKIMAF
ncbi:hypothetical protein HUF18_12520 [Thalassolituus sp. ST750PaO-4]|uniref:hypothetical protein n=1 Tax=Thalassolituus sp. ST750PaO-4 TaxID=2742965 RepID=UPI001CE315F8|nr:hypothetical protein [Thalassolituus sp. ST750PaO-4]MCA6060606.1 hypothetical protein [Thalassolituus sp. ST750PaO-4]